MPRNFESQVGLPPATLAKLSKALNLARRTNRMETSLPGLFRAPNSSSGPAMRPSARMRVLQPARSFAGFVVRHAFVFRTGSRSAYYIIIITTRLFFPAGRIIVIRLLLAVTGRLLLLLALHVRHTFVISTHVIAEGVSSQTNR